LKDFGDARTDGDSALVRHLFLPQSLFAGDIVRFAAGLGKSIIATRPRRGPQKTNAKRSGTSPNTIVRFDPKREQFEIRVILSGRGVA
jgi:hypothetical protein